MRFLEYETWRIADSSSQGDHDNMVREWFLYVARYKEELFGEWVSARYFQQVDANGAATGVYVMLFEYDSMLGHHAYKNRRLHSYAMEDGIYEHYRSIDPYQLFDESTVTTDYIQPEKTDLWFDIPVTDSYNKFISYTTWRLKKEADLKAYNALIEAHFERIRADVDCFCASRYYKMVTREAEHIGGYSIFHEYMDINAFKGSDIYEEFIKTLEEFAGNIEVVYMQVKEKHLWIDYSASMNV